MIRTKAELLERMKANPHMHAEICHGVRDHRWGWLRDGRGSDTIMVHIGAIRALERAGVIKRVDSLNSRSSRFVL